MEQSKQAMTDARTRILERIRSSLQTNRSMLEAQAAQFPPPHPHGPFVATDLDLIEQFRTELSGLHAHVHVCDGVGMALEVVCDLLDQAGVREVLTWAPEHLPLPDLLPTLAAAGITSVDGQVLGAAREAQYAALDPIAACISGVDAAIAESGTMLLVSGAGRGRLASLLPPLHLALLPADNIVRTLPDALDLLRGQFGASLFQDRSNLTMITGPSRTADIELSLTLGVHGPRDVHAIVIQ